VSSRLSFVLNDPAANVILPGVGFLYNADTQTLLIKVSPEQRTFVLNTEAPVLATMTLKSDLKGLGHYTAQNTFGATAEVDNILDQEYGLAFKTGIWLGREELFFSMAPEEARRLYPNLRALLLCRLTEPYLQSQRPGGPTGMDN
jgi:hypothetical protein